MPLKTQQDEQPTLNLTPMIDVVFLLIIFFMAATKFTSDERDIDVNVPEVGNATQWSSANATQIVNVDRHGGVSLNGQVMELEELAARLRAEKTRHPELQVTVRGDAEGTFQSVASVLHACRQAGVRDMAISVRIARRP